MNTHPFKKRVCSNSVLTLLLLFFFSFSAISQVDVALQLSADKEIVEINEIVTFTITANNVPQTTVTGLIIHFDIPSTLNYDNHTAPAGTSFNNLTGNWQIGNQLAANTSELNLILSVSPNSEGTHFLIGEVSNIDGIEYNSTPQNGDFRENDIVLGGVTVPIFIAAGTDSIELIAPPVSGGHQWEQTINNTTIVVSTDSIFVASIAGVYTYFNSNYVCGAAGCFDIIVNVIQPCSVNIIALECDDNATINEAADDFFEITLTTSPSNINNSSQYFIDYNGIILNPSGTNYNNLFTITHPDFIADGLTDITLIIQDPADENCLQTITVTAPPNCSVYSNCDFYSTLIENNCCQICESGNLEIKTAYWQPEYINLLQSNLALHKPVFFNGTPSYSGSNASLSVDGQLEGNSNLPFDYAFSIGGENNYWDIDLVGNYDLDSLKIYTKTGCCGSMASNYRVFISEIPFTTTDMQELLTQINVQNYTLPIMTNGFPSIHPDLNTMGRFVRIYLEGTGQMQLVEVEIIGNGTPNSNPYHYSWSDLNIGNTANPNCLSSGNYTVNITDIATGCLSTALIEVEE